MFKPPFILILLLIVVLSACDALGGGPTPTPTWAFSAPTLAPSPTVPIRSSDQLYADDIHGQNDPTAAAQPNQGNLPPLASGTRTPGGAEPVRIVMDDDTLLEGALYRFVSDRLVPGADLEAQRPARVPGILILGRNRNDWGDFPARLHTQGYTVLLMSMRDAPQATDVDRLLESLAEVSTVDPARLAVIGAGNNANWGLAGCARQALCDALVLLTPVAQPALMDWAQAYAPRPLFVAAARDDAEGYPAAQALVATTDGQLFTAETGREAGLLLLYADLPGQIIAWLQAQLG